jgi:hypothetical protein
MRVIPGQAQNLTDPHTGRDHQQHQEPVPVVRHAAQQNFHLIRAEVLGCSARFPVLDCPGLNVSELFLFTDVEPGRG